MEIFKPPSVMLFSNGNVAENWKKWVQKFQNFMLASEKNQKSDDVKIAILLNLLGDEGIEIYNTFKQHRDGLNPEKFEDVMQYFTKRCAVQQNVVFERYKFFSSNQCDGQKFDDYLAQLEALAGSCKFGKEQESLIRDKIVLGTNDSSLQEALLREPALTLKQAIRHARNSEAAKKHPMKILSNNSEEPTNDSEEGRGNQQQPTCSKVNNSAVVSSREHIEEIEGQPQTDIIVLKSFSLAEPSACKKRKGDLPVCPLPKRLKFHCSLEEIRILPYGEQLKRKQDHIKKFLITLSKMIECPNITRIGNERFMKLIRRERIEHYDQFCVLNEILPCPVATNYCNLWTFYCGRHFLTKEVTVGFSLGKDAEGWLRVDQPDSCCSIEEPTLSAVKVFQSYIRESKLDVYKCKDGVGYWKKLTIRTSNNSDIMLIVVIHVQKLSHKELDEEKMKLKKYFEVGEGSTVGVTSLYLQAITNYVKYENLPVTHLMGKKFLEESLLGMKFQMSPFSKIHTNIPAAEVLYTLLVKLVNPHSTVLNLNCGSGTISICLAKAGLNVIGIDACPDEVENARINARQANISNVDFVCGKTAFVIHPTLQRINCSDVVAVVESPEIKLNQSTILAIRAAEQISQVIFLTRNPRSAIQKFLTLCRSCEGIIEGPAFCPVSADVVDIGPNTPEIELVMLFKRSSDINLFPEITQEGRIEHVEEAASMETSEKEQELPCNDRTCSELIARISGAELSGDTSTETSGMELGLSRVDRTCNKEPSDTGIDAQLSAEMQSEMASNGNVIVKKEPLCEPENDSAQLSGKVLSEMTSHGNVIVKKEPF